MTCWYPSDYLEPDFIVLIALICGQYTLLTTLRFIRSENEDYESESVLSSPFDQSKPEFDIVQGSQSRNLFGLRLRY